MKNKLESVKDLLTDPDTTINYSKNNWSKKKAVIIFIISSYLYGFNFFWSNFNVEASITSLLLVSLLPMVGLMIASILLFPYIGCVSLGMRLLVRKGESETLNKDKEITKKKDLNDYTIVTKSNSIDWLKVFSFTFLIPFLIYNLIFSLVVISLIPLNLTYLVSYLYVYSRLFLYLVIITLTLYSMNYLNTDQKYKMNLIVLISSTLCYFILSMLILYFEQFMKGFFI